MAALRTDSPPRGYSSGRGGAGNIGTHRPSGGAVDLVTPTIKADMYTTGRGGSGNMAKMDNVDVARIAQDVEPPQHREHESAFHYGRGGAANVATPSEEDAKKAHQKNERSSEERARQHAEEKGLAEKSRELLGKIGVGSKK